MRAKLVPVSRVEDMAASDAGFAPFAAHFDLGPYDGDLLAIPDPTTLIRLPWNTSVGWLACDLILAGKELAEGPRNMLRSVQSQLAQYGLTMKTGVECEFFLLDGNEPVGKAVVGDSKDVAAKPCYEAGALMRRCVDDQFAAPAERWAARCNPMLPSTGMGCPIMQQPDAALYWDGPPINTKASACNRLLVLRAGLM